MIEAVAFVDSVGDVEVGFCAEQAEAQEHDGGGRHAVGIVVAVDGDAAAVANGAVQNGGGFDRAGQLFRVAQAAELHVEKAAGAVDIDDAAPNQQLGDNRRNV